MNKYIQEYQKIVSTVVKKSFPSLKNKKIRIIEYGILTGPYYFFTSGFEAYLFGTHLVGFNIKLRKLKDSKEEVLNALIAHELCHAEDHEKFKNDIEIIIHCIKYAISQISGKSYCRITERKTDIQTIKKGYGKELLIMAKRREKRFSKKRLKWTYKRGYLSPKEIKKYIKQSKIK